MDNLSAMSMLAFIPNGQAKEVEVFLAPSERSKYRTRFRPSPPRKTSYRLEADQLESTER
jgi:hypothetical protein